MNPSHTKGPTGRRARSRTVRFYSTELVRKYVDPERPVFRMGDGTPYAQHESGAFVRMNKDRRPVKERKRARREARNA